MGILPSRTRKMYNKNIHSHACIITNEGVPMKDQIGRLFKNIKSAFKRKSHYTATYRFGTASTQQRKEKAFKFKLRPILIISAATVIVACAVLLIVLSMDTGQNNTIAQNTSPNNAPTSINTGSPASADSQDTPQEPDPNQTPNTDKGLNPGDTSGEVSKLQQRLMDLNYMDPDEPTEYYGPQTSYAIQLFQRKHKLQIDGIAGPETLKMIYASDAKSYTVYLEDKGTDVTEIQKRLKELGYLKSTPTGFFGTDTANAVKSFQKRNSLATDGNVGENTREVLYSEDAKKASKPAPAKSTTTTSAKMADKAPDADKAATLIEFAKQQLGKTYVRGGKGPDTFDCSGFVYYCLKSTVLNIGYRTSAGWAQSSWPRVASMKDLMPGDIICYRGHVGISLGGGQMIDASSSQGKVRITTLSTPYWHKYFRFGCRVL